MEILFLAGVAILIYVLCISIKNIEKNAPQNKKLILPIGNNDVIIESSGQDKIALLTAIRNILACDLITGKNIVDNLPYTILTDISEEAANDIKAILEKTGSVVTIKTK